MASTMDKQHKKLLFVVVCGFSCFVLWFYSTAYSDVRYSNHIIFQPAPVDVIVHQSSDVTKSKVSKMETGQAREEDDHLDKDSGYIIRSDLAAGESAIDTSGKNAAAGYRYLSSLYSSHKFNYRRVISYNLTDDWLTTMDRQLLRDSFTDITRVASPKTSEVFISSQGRRQQRVSVKVGDKVTVVVKVKDEKGREVTKGGHDLRVWMVGSEEYGARRAAVDVTDMRNGTYVTSLPVLWQGETRVKVALYRPREFRRTIIRLLHKLKMFAPLVASFETKNASQSTLCGVIPVIPGYSAVCNLTTLFNHGLPMYCGMPTRANLTCHDHYKTRSSGALYSFPEVLTKVENQLLDRILRRGDKLGKLSQIVTFVASFDSTNSPTISTNSCILLKPRDTWDDQSPRGYWQKKEWHSLIGCPLPPLESANQCLRNKTVIVLGGSNAGQVVQALEKVIPSCKQNSDTRGTSFNQMCPNGAKLIWKQQAFPRMSFTNWFAADKKISPAVVIRSLDDVTEYVIVLHLYIHFAFVHSAIFAQHWHETAVAVRDLVRRNSKARVFVRGPHSLIGADYRFTGDYHAMRTLQIVRHEFRDLKDHVTLLNAWDMSVAIENEQVHPFPHVLESTVRMLLSHVCHS